jgi:hypothetical protein
LHGPERSGHPISQTLYGFVKCGVRARPAGLGTARDERERVAALPEDGRAQFLAKREARPAGLEPATPGLEGRCSIRTELRAHIVEVSV